MPRRLRSTKVNHFDMSKVIYAVVVLRPNGCCVSNELTWLVEFLELLEKCLNLKFHFKGTWKLLENENFTLKIDQAP